MLHVHVSVSFAKYGTLTALTIFGQNKGAGEFGRGGRRFLQCLACPLCVMTFFPHLWIYIGHCLQTIASVDVRN